MKNTVKLFTVLFAVSFLAVQANAQLTDVPGQAAKPAVAGKKAAVSVQTASPASAVATKPAAATTQKAPVFDPKQTPGLTSAVAEKTTTAKLSVVSDQGGVQPVLIAEASAAKATLAKLEAAPAEVEKPKEEPKVEPASSDKKMSDMKKQN